MRFSSSRIVAGIVAAVVVASVVAAAPASAKPHKRAPVAKGAPITVTEAVDIAALAKDPASFAGKTVRLEGTVKEVCQGRGCWVEVVDAKGASFMAKSLDESILLPKNCAGRGIIVQGVVTTLGGEEKAEAKTEAKTEAKEGSETAAAEGHAAMHEGHEAKEGGKDAGEAGVAPHECPRPTFVVSTQGVRLK